MADKINGYGGRVGLDVGPTRGRAVPRSGEGGPSEGARRAEKRDAVELTDAAARLKAVEARLAEVPDVDRARVEAARQKIESGEYRPDPERIAAKLIRMEQELA
jgi:negative regulator of flagellin synthesis FlgM